MGFGLYWVLEFFCSNEQLGSCFNFKPRDHVTPVLRGLHWLPTAVRIDYKQCLLVHTTLLGHTPVNIADLLTYVANIPAQSSLHASANNNFIVTRTEPFLSLCHVHGTDLRQNLNSCAALQLLDVNLRHFYFSHHSKLINQ